MSPGGGRLVGVFATSHSPGLTGFPDRADAAQLAATRQGFDELRRRILRAAPDVLVIVTVDHFTNFSLANLPTFAIGCAERFLGPVTAEMSRFLGIAQRHYTGSPLLGEHLYAYALEHDFDPALVAGDLAFDENVCVPLATLDLDDVPVVPVIVNAVNHPGPTPRRCVAFGRMLADGIRAQSDAQRVAVLATGGLSHWVGMRESGRINEAFDRDFLDRLASGQEARLAGYSQDEIDAAGNGADEIRAWLVAAGAAGTGFDTLAYEPVAAWLTGTALAAARLATSEPKEQAS